MDYDRDRKEPQGSVVLPSINQLTKGMNHQNTPSQGSSVAFDPARDSGNWSMQSGQSKHSSTVSSTPGHHLHSILNSEEPANRYSQTSSLGASSASRFPSSQHSTPLPHLSQPFDQQSHHSVDVNNTSFLDSRRSSIDSRVNVNMNHLAINHAATTSPYDGNNNHSQSSLVANLQQQRGIQTPTFVSRSTAPQSSLSPLGNRARSSNGTAPPIKQAPPIMANPRQGAPDPTASTPTKGYAWAFPDKPDEDMDDDDHSRNSSRQNSITASSLQTLDSNLALGSGNYSRTPELRVSHKLAERKRRSEMKDLFDTLNRILPATPANNKSSKWEVLSRAIDYINNLKGAYDNSQREVQHYKDELQRVHNAGGEHEILGLKNEITHMYQQLLRVDPHGHHVFGPHTQFLDSQESKTSQRLAPIPAGHQPPPSHPPPAAPASAGWATQHSGSGPMQGIEYR